MGAYDPNSGIHPVDGPNGARHWRMFIGQGGIPAVHDGPSNTNDDDVEIIDGVASILIQAARMSYAIEDAPGTHESDVFSKAIDAFAPPEWGAWYGALSAAWQERIRDNVRLVPDPLMVPWT